MVYVLCMYKAWMEGTCDIPYINPYFFVTILKQIKQIFAEM